MTYTRGTARGSSCKKKKKKKLASGGIDALAIRYPQELQYKEYIITYSTLGLLGSVLFTDPSAAGEIRASWFRYPCLNVSLYCDARMQTRMHAQSPRKEQLREMQPSGEYRSLKRGYAVPICYEVYSRRSSLIFRVAAWMLNH